jgi:hypothetical protein
MRLIKLTSENKNAFFRINSYYISKLFLLLLTLFQFMLISCSKNDFLEIELKEIESVFKNTSNIEKNIKLDKKTILYLDHSTCVIDAVNNSYVWKAVFPNFTQYTDELVLIKGSEFERIELERNDNKVETTLKRIDKDLPWADIDKAVQEIVKGNNQAILISDFEAFDSGTGTLTSKTRDLVPYLSPWLKSWIERGFSIYIITEPYKESYNGRLVDKKRFYFIFTDDKLDAPISANVQSQIDHLIKNGTCQLFKMTNSDISVVSPKSDISANDLDFSVEYGKGFDFISIENSWDDIREYVMKLDKYGEPIPEEEKQPFVKNFKLNHGVNYKVENIKVIATNITADFVADKKNIKGKDISAAFVVDENALKNNLINVNLTDKIFNNDFINAEHGGNLIRLDFVIDQVSIQPYDKSIFEWVSLYKNETAICVSKSIENALLDVNVIPSNEKRKLIHTVFIKTTSYK